MTSDPFTLDLVEELQLRRWARENYVPAAERCEKWHPVILNEMQLRDYEAGELLSPTSPGQTIVPLKETRILRLDAAHVISGPARQFEAGVEINR